MATETTALRIQTVAANGQAISTWMYAGDDCWTDEVGSHGLTLEDVLCDLEAHVEELLHGD